MVSQTSCGLKEAKPSLLPVTNNSKAGGYRIVIDGYSLLN
jgi:hypothetical protein